MGWVLVLPTALAMAQAMEKVGASAVLLPLRIQTQ
jgi:hypothetical protein